MRTKCFKVWVGYTVMVLLRMEYFAMANSMESASNTTEPVINIFWGSMDNQLNRLRKVLGFLIRKLAKLGENFTFDRLISTMIYRCSISLLCSRQLSKAPCNCPTKSLRGSLHLQLL